MPSTAAEHVELKQDVPCRLAKHGSAEVLITRAPAHKYLCGSGSRGMLWVLGHSRPSALYQNRCFRLREQSQQAGRVFQIFAGKLYGFGIHPVSVAIHE